MRSMIKPPMIQHETQVNWIGLGETSRNDLAAARKAKVGRRQPWRQTVDGGVALCHCADVREREKGSNGGWKWGWKMTKMDMGMDTPNDYSYTCHIITHYQNQLQLPENGRPEVP
ncbi:hypothetical protein RHGRI_007267 [Rhododendron griersonianum]|uniref:Uncharacterized protein n=1 Tax=Rhododendron griersonianum TaxID=479676 RepID=A0AAV6KWA5_9ERIC|nr:hypothetical protein RHGRI_007267 [Rhododendron griersonianum]